MRLQHMQRHNIQSPLMGGLQIGLWGAAFIMRLQETRSAEAPLISGFEPCEVKLRPGCGQVIAHIFGECQKLCGHHGADRMAALIFCAGVAMTISEKTGDRIQGTGGQLLAQHVYGGILFHHEVTMARAVSVRQWESGSLKKLNVHSRNELTVATGCAKHGAYETDYRTRPPN